MVLTSRQYHRQVLIPHFELRPPNVDGKPMVSVDELRVILVFNIAYDQSIFPGERHRIHLAGCYLLLSYTGARPAELVYSERKKPKDGTVAELFGSKVVMRTDGGGENPRANQSTLRLMKPRDDWTSCSWRRQSDVDVLRRSATRTSC